MPHNWRAPTLITFALILGLGLLAGFGEWSVTAVTGGAFVVFLIWALLIARADGIIGRHTTEH